MIISSSFQVSHFKSYKAGSLFFCALKFDAAIIFRKSLKWKFCYLSIAGSYKHACDLSVSWHVPFDLGSKYSQIASERSTRSLAWLDQVLFWNLQVMYCIPMAFQSFSFYMKLEEVICGMLIQWRDRMQLTPGPSCSKAG